MKLILIQFTLAASLLAGEVSEDKRTSSPDGSFKVSIVKVGDTNTRRLEIAGKDGKPLYVSPPKIDGTDIADFYTDHLRWSPDSRILAISAGYSKLFHTYLFAWDGTRFQQIPMPAIAASQDNPWIFPTEWKENHILHLKITGPHAGKAHDGGYEGTAVVQVDLQTKTSKMISEKVKQHASADRDTSSYWFPKMSDIPPIVPALPDDFIPGVVTNKHIGDGKPTLVWGRVSDIRNLNEGATGTTPIFVITERIREAVPWMITPANREEFISSCAAAKRTDIKCGTGRIDGWNLEWASMRSPYDYSFNLALSKLGRENQIAISLIAGEFGLPVWDKFLSGIKKSLEVVTPELIAKEWIPAGAQVCYRSQYEDGFLPDGTFCLKLKITKKQFDEIVTKLEATPHTEERKYSDDKGWLRWSRPDHQGAQDPFAEANQDVKLPPKGENLWDPDSDLSTTFVRQENGTWKFLKYEGKYLYYRELTH